MTYQLEVSDPHCALLIHLLLVLIQHQTFHQVPRVNLVVGHLLGNRVQREWGGRRKDLASLSQSPHGNLHTNNTFRQGEKRHTLTARKGIRLTTLQQRPQNSLLKAVYRIEYQPQVAFRGKTFLMLVNGKLSDRRQNAL